MFAFWFLFETWPLSAVRRLILGVIRRPLTRRFLPSLHQELLSPNILIQWLHTISAFRNIEEYSRHDSVYWDGIGTFDHFDIARNFLSQFLLLHLEQERVRILSSLSLKIGSLRHALFEFVDGWGVFVAGMADQLFFVFELFGKWVLFVAENVVFVVVLDGLVDFYLVFALVLRVGLDLVDWREGWAFAGADFGVNLLFWSGGISSFLLLSLVWEVLLWKWNWRY